MTYLILTHDAYRITSLITLSLGSFYIANQIYQHCIGKISVNLVDVNLLIKFLIVILGCTVVSWNSLFSGNITTEFLGMAIGICLGYVCLSLETYLLSVFQKRGKPVQRSQSRNSASLNSILTSKPTYFSIVTVGALEEVIYRGILTALCLALLNYNASLICLFFITLLFALSHINFGSIHVLTKFILGSVCLLSFFITQTIVTPIFVHVMFNTLVVMKYRQVAND